MAASGSGWMDAWAIDDGAAVGGRGSESGCAMASGGVGGPGAALVVVGSVWEDFWNKKRSSRRGIDKVAGTPSKIREGPSLVGLSTSERSPASSKHSRSQGWQHRAPNHPSSRHRTTASPPGHSGPSPSNRRSRTRSSKRRTCSPVLRHPRPAERRGPRARRARRLRLHRANLRSR